MDAADADEQDDWASALSVVAEGGYRRVVVIGPTDVGKSHFISKARALAEPGRPLRLIDLDPGQKMVGPPGTAGLACGHSLDRLVFLGSTSASEISKITKAAALLARGSEPFIVNSSGWVQGIGGRLQSLTIASLKADLIVAIGPEELLQPIITAHERVPLPRLQPSKHARRKTPAERARARQGAFLDALAASRTLLLPTRGLAFVPAEPGPFADALRPVCGLGDAAGEAMSIAILEQWDVDQVTVTAPPTARPATLLHLGKMWAEPGDGGWRLLERLAPSWMEPS